MKTLRAVFQNKVVAVSLFVGICLALSLGIGFLLVKVGFLNMPEQKYSVVYLDTGDIYIGQLRMFPFPTLCKGYVLQRTQTGTQLISFADTVWSPDACMRLNKKHMVFWTETSGASQIAQMIQQYGVKSGQPSSTSPTPIPTPVPTPSK